MQSSITENHLPSRCRTYKNHALDSTSWDQFKPRNGDVIITTALKAGTTWMQTIVGNLIFQDRAIPGPLWQLTPWLDSRGGSLEEDLALLEAQTHRRFLKTHLPLDALPYAPQIKYIYVGRDGRDVFMSLWNHYRHMQPGLIARFNRSPERAQDPFPSCPDDIHAFFKMWIGTSWFSWEHDGYPFWSLFYHLRSWWAYRHLPNILFVHFNDLLVDLDGQMRRVARYLDIEIDETIWPALVDKATFNTMKANAENVVPDGGSFLTGGARRFLNKGTNGRWKGVLTQEELALYEEKTKKELGPDSRKWIELGMQALEKGEKTNPRC
ncbi:MAG: sulfotransferase domain-containing protein [Anaerolineae bacterium]|nr:sulfotransferase domain-containing protein [Anaerolineae bacterium]